MKNKKIMIEVFKKLKNISKKIKNSRKTPRLGFEPRRLLHHGISSPAPYQARLSRHMN